MNDSEKITAGIRTVLYGVLQPDKVVKSYPLGDQEPYKKLWQMPQTPKEYLSENSELLTHWLDQEDELHEQDWTEPYWLPVGLERDPFHPLCYFYKHLLECESRMILGKLTEWMEMLEFTLVRFTMVNIQKELIELLKEGINRKKQLTQTDGNQLERYIYHLMYTRLLALLFDIQTRFRHCFKDRLITHKELFLIYLERAQPKETEIFLTAAGSAFELARVAPDRGALQQVEEMLLTCRKTGDLIKDNDLTTDILNSVSILENAWFVVKCKGKNGDEACPEAASAEQNETTLNQLYEEIEESGLRGERLQKLIDISVEFRGQIASKIAAAPSLAGKISREVLEAVEQYSDMNVNRKTGNDQPNRANSVKQHSSVLDEYIPLHELLKKLNVSDVTLNKYLKEAPVEIIKYSQKTKFIHRDDVRTMMERLNELTEEYERVAITCFEREHTRCHRHKISDHLQAQYGVPIEHI